MKYEAQAAEVSNLLSPAKNILITLPSQPSVDDLASGLALLLSLEQSGKKASIVTEGIIRVGHTNLFGVGEIKSQIPAASGGNFTITLGGVVSKDASNQSVVPALERISWDPVGSDLKLVFHNNPSQRFEPTQVVPGYEGGSFDLIFTVGALNLETLGNLYASSQQTFTSVTIINLDNKPGNTSFGKVNIIDTTASSVSEIMAQVLLPLHLPIEGDIATNLLSGIFEATGNLQNMNVTADTFETMAILVRSGGQKPGAQPASPSQDGVAPQAPVAAPSIQPASPASPNRGEPNASLGGQPPAPTFDSAAFQQIFNINPAQPASPASPNRGEPDASQGGPAQTPPAVPVTENFTVPPVVNENPQPQSEENQPSPEEAPNGEGADSQNPEADWLTPKIYKGSSLG